MSLNAQPTKHRGKRPTASAAHGCVMGPMIVGMGQMRRTVSSLKIRSFIAIWRNAAWKLWRLQYMQISNPYETVLQLKCLGIVLSAG